MSDTGFRDRYGPAALVTGASSGIGRAFAEALAAEGLDLVLVARRLDRLEALAARLSAEHGIRVKPLQADLSLPGAAAEIAGGAAGFEIGLLVSNAGFGFKGHFDAGDPGRMSDVLMTNCHAPMLLARAFAPGLRARGKGGIILTASVEGLIGGPYSTVYAASKAFVISLGEGLWGELTPEGIDVLTICPGATDTEAMALNGIDRTKVQNMMAPEDVVALALENLREGPTYVTSDHYRALFQGMLAMPRRDALTAMAKAMRPAG
jgi:short-subunit dehydrogenase